MLLLSGGLSGQRIADELIVEWLSGHGPAKGRDNAYRIRGLTEHIDLLTFPDSSSAEMNRAKLLSSKATKAVQFNYRITPRALPDDPLYQRQQNFARSGFEAAWDVTTGGTTATGIPIVTAVLDAGFDIGHEDLSGNLWSNPEEVPGDGLDNDGNGYVDDVEGWNFVDDHPAFDPETHGTAVAGLLGAVGNNGVGVAGSNWSAHLMLLQISTVADIIEAYEYAITQRRLFNESSGLRGALVVSTNASFGIEGATCTEYPVWGGMYDRLGAVGILTAASVSNVSEDVDTYGDMPTDCPSEYLVAVANADGDDRLHPSSAYGATVVDLAAPGEGSFTTRPGDAYSGFGGTSAAAPYVAGAISLLYATPCPYLNALSLRDPPSAARLVRDAVVGSTARVPSLTGKSVTGGVLQVAVAQAVLLEACESGDEAFGILSVSPNPTAGRTTVRTNAMNGLSELEITAFDAAGRRIGPLPLQEVEGIPGALEVDLTPLAAGIYWLRLTGPDRSAVVKCAVF